VRVALIESDDRATARLAGLLDAEPDLRVEWLRPPPTPAGDWALPGALPALEAALAELRPAALLVWGSDPDALAAGLAAAKLEVALVSLDAGRRPDDAGPEEPPHGSSLEPALVDRLAALRLCRGTPEAERLRAEGLAEGAHVVGDPAADPGACAAAVLAWLAER
jgi:hypothetical protein